MNQKFWGKYTNWCECSYIPKKYETGQFSDRQSDWMFDVSLPFSRSKKERNGDKVQRGIFFGLQVALFLNVSAASGRASLQLITCIKSLSAVSVLCTNIQCCIAKDTVTTSLLYTCAWCFHLNKKKQLFLNHQKLFYQFILAFLSKSIRQTCFNSSLVIYGNSDWKLKVLVQNKFLLDSNQTQNEITDYVLIIETTNFDLNLQNLNVW